MLVIDYLIIFHIGKINIEALVDFQLENQKYLIENSLEKIGLRKIRDVKNVRNMLRYIFILKDLL
jgi:hypothetical protein